MVLPKHSLRISGKNLSNAKLYCKWGEKTHVSLNCRR